MTTLGALSVGLLLLVAVAVALLAWWQRRSRPAPGQPRTVADLVRMREEAAARAAVADLSGSEGSTPARPAVGSESEQASAESLDASTAAATTDAATTDAATTAEGTAGPLAPEDDDAVREGAAAPVEERGSAEDAGSAREDRDPAWVPGQSSSDDTPWARAARMADQWSPPHGTRPSAGRPDGRRATGGPRSVPTPRDRGDAPATPPPSLALLYPPERAAARLSALSPTPAAPPAASPHAAADPAVDAGAAATAQATAADSAAVGAPQVPAAGSAVASQAPAAPEAATAGPAAADVSEAPDAPSAVAEAADVRTPGSEQPSPAGAMSATPAPGVDQATTAGSLEPAHAEPPTNGHAVDAPVPTPARVAGRVRRSPSATAAEQAAADLALLRTFGVAHRPSAAEETEVELEGCAAADDEPAQGAAQPVVFQVVGRDGRGVPHASVSLLDDHGREAAGTVADADGRGELTARHPGSYMVVTAADGYQPGAITLAVGDGPVDTEIPLTRSASVAGAVSSEDGPVVGAQLVLVQDGEIVATAESAADGAYRFADVAAGEYGLSVSAPECEPAAVVLRVADEEDLRQDVDLDPAGLPADHPDVMIGHL